MKKFIEVEFKYNASKIDLTAFFDYCNERNPAKYILASGWDYFYAKEGVKGFARHRVGSDFNQLTYKRKTSNDNNFIRAEDNINLLTDVSTEQVDSFLSKFGYKQVASIYKNCFIFKFSNYSIVYYVIFDRSILEIGRFIEIEMDEDHPWEDEGHALSELINIEKQCKSLGLSAKGRLKKSLYEVVCGR